MLRVRYQTFEFGQSDIHVRALRDRQQYDDESALHAEQLGVSSASWSLFGVVWPSSELLAQMMFEYEIEGKRILEVGCGMALASLVLNHRSADITATDYNPEVEAFLLENTKLNQDNDIPFERIDWADNVGTLGEFDLIIGSDLLYEPDHVDLLADFIHQHSKPQCKVIITDPGRGLHPRFSINMLRLGYSHSQQKPSGVNHLGQEFKGQVLTYSR